MIELLPHKSRVLDCDIAALHLIKTIFQIYNYNINNLCVLTKFTEVSWALIIIINELSELYMKYQH